LHVLKKYGFRRKLIFTSKVKRVTGTIVVVKVCLVMVLSMLEILGGGRFETERVRSRLGNMEFLVTIFTFAPCMLLHLLYLKPTRALVLNTLSHPHFANVNILNVSVAFSPFFQVCHSLGTFKS
jgi:hypothetical protein